MLTNLPGISWLEDTQAFDNLEECSLNGASKDTVAEDSAIEDSADL